MCPEKTSGDCIRSVRTRVTSRGTSTVLNRPERGRIGIGHVRRCPDICGDAIPSGKNVLVAELAAWPRRVAEVAAHPTPRNRNDKHFDARRGKSRHVEHHAGHGHGLHLDQRDVDALALLAVIERQRRGLVRRRRCWMEDRNGFAPVGRQGLHFVLAGVEVANPVDALLVSVSDPRDAVAILRRDLNRHAFGHSPIRQSNGAHDGGRANERHREIVGALSDRQHDRRPFPTGPERAKLGREKPRLFRAQVVPIGGQRGERKPASIVADGYRLFPRRAHQRQRGGCYRDAVDARDDARDARGASNIARRRLRAVSRTANARMRSQSPRTSRRSRRSGHCGRSPWRRSYATAMRPTGRGRSRRSSGA